MEVETFGFAADTSLFLILLLANAEQHHLFSRNFFSTAGFTIFPFIVGSGTKKYACRMYQGSKTLPSNPSPVAAIRRGENDETQGGTTCFIWLNCL
jgi:hypothetical protein